MRLFKNLKNNLTLTVIVSLVVLTGCDNMTSSLSNDNRGQENDYITSYTESPDPIDGDIIPGQYIVIMKDDTPDVMGGVNQMAKSTGTNVTYVFEKAFKGFSITVPEQASEQAIEEIKRNPNVVSVEPDRKIYAAGDQTDAPWGLDRIDQRDLPLNDVYSYKSTGKGVTAYVIDGGINYDHVDFGGRAVEGFSVFDDDGSDCNGHGTSVAGIIGGSEWGVAKDVKLVSVKVLDCDGSGSLSSLFQGIEWVTNNASGPSVANVSIVASANSTLDNAIRNSIDAGITYVAAAGNNTRNALFYSPARMKEVLTVGSTNNKDEKVSNSNFGDALDIFAPGSGIRSATYNNDTGSRTMTGTSAAAPHVAGAVAQFLEKNPSATPAQAFSAITDNATKGIVKNSSSDNNHLLYVTPASSSSGSSDDDDKDGDDGNDDEKDEEIVENDPKIENFIVVTRNTGPWLRAEVDWRVSDEDGDLKTVKIALLDGNNTVDSSSSNVSGGSASGSASLRTNKKADSIRLIVTDSKGNEEVKTIKI